MTPPAGTYDEAATRQRIDEKLITAGWVIQDKKRLNLFESLGIAVREIDIDPVRPTAYCSSMARPVALSSPSARVPILVVSPTNPVQVIQRKQ